MLRWSDAKILEYLEYARRARAQEDRLATMDQLIVEFTARAREAKKIGPMPT